MEEMTLALLVKTKRKELGLSQRTLCEMIGMNSAELSRLEAGKRKKMGIGILVGFAKIFDVDLTYIMELAGYSQEQIIYVDSSLSGLPVNKYNEITEKNNSYKAVLNATEYQVNKKRWLTILLKSLVDDIEKVASNLELKGNERQLLDDIKEIKVIAAELNDYFIELRDYLAQAALNPSVNELIMNASKY